MTTPFHTETRHCAYALCSEDFTPRSHHHRYCSSICKDRARRLRQSVGEVAGETEPLTRQYDDRQMAEGVAPLRILFFDIETAPMLAYIWQARADWVGHNQITHETFLLSWAAKWADDDHIFGDVLTADEARAQEDIRIVQSLAEMIRQADIVVAHNGDRFDIPMLNNRLLLWGDIPLGSVKTIDTCTLARRSFRLSHNKLDHLAQELGFGTKISTDFSLWQGCYHGDEDALAQMYEYNRHDVVLLQQVYEAMAPYVKGLPRLVDGADGEDACPFCGHKDLVEDDVYRTNASTFPRFRCEGCNRHSRGRKAMKSRKVGVVPLA